MLLNEIPSYAPILCIFKNNIPNMSSSIMARMFLLEVLSYVKKHNYYLYQDINSIRALFQYTNTNKGIYVYKLEFWIQNN